MKNRIIVSPLILLSIVFTTSCLNSIQRDSIQSLSVAELLRKPNLYNHKKIRVRGVIIGNCLWSSTEVFQKFMNEWEADTERPNEIGLRAIWERNVIAVTNNLLWRENKELVEKEVISVQGTFQMELTDTHQIFEGCQAKHKIILEIGEDKRILDSIKAKL